MEQTYINHALYESSESKSCHKEEERKMGRMEVVQREWRLYHSWPHTHKTHSYVNIIIYNLYIYARRNEITIHHVFQVVKLTPCEQQRQIREKTSEQYQAKPCCVCVSVCVCTRAFCATNLSMQNVSTRREKFRVIRRISCYNSNNI